MFGSWGMRAAWFGSTVSVMLLAIPWDVDAAPPRQPAGTVVQAVIPEAIGGKFVVGNLAVDEQGGDGFVTAYPCDQPRPLKSDLNAIAGPPQSNRFLGLADAAGRICFVSNVGTSLVFDAKAVIDRVLSFPNRRTDTRDGARVAAQGVLEILVPEAVGGKVVVGNLAVDQQLTGGFVTAYPCDQPKPLAADLNFGSAGAASNRFVGQASADGRVCLSPSTPTHIVFDAHAILLDAVPFGPRRFDTRGFNRVTPTRPLEVTVPEAVGGRTVIGNLAIDRQIGTGFVTAYPCSEPRPLASDLNFFQYAGAFSNRFVGRADASGRLCFHASTEVDIIFDVSATLGGVTPFPNHRTDTRLAASPPPCTTQQLAARAVPAPAIAPFSDMTVSVTNNGPTCELGGYPSVTGVTSDGESIELAAHHGTFDMPYPLATITPGETLTAKMSSVDACPDSVPPPRDRAWTAYVLRFPGGGSVRVDALIQPLCGFGISLFGVRTTIPVSVPPDFG